MSDRSNKWGNSQTQRAGKKVPGEKPGESLAFDFGSPEPPPVSIEREIVAPAPPPPLPPPPLPAAPPPSSLEPAPASWLPPSLPPRPPPSERKASPGPRVLSVAQLGRAVGRSLERTFTEDVWVEGEVSGARPAASGHVYFAMKDEQEDATMDVVLYRSQVSPRGRALIKDGARVKVRGKPAYWSPRGRVQFVGDRVEPTGKGALLEALEQLKQKLQAEGLFAPERKRPLPHDPRVVGVVTSAKGAVIHDVCKVAFRRGGARILLAPASVQGSGSVDSIRRALRALQKIRSVDVIIIGRGGGSHDDLLAFNDELVVREVAACRVPVVSAVGHETDVTLVDFAADARAATPSQAAEMVVPDSGARRRLLEERTLRLQRAVQAKIAEDRVMAGQLAQAFGDPRLLIAKAQQRVDEHRMRLTNLANRWFASKKEESGHLVSRLLAAHPRERIARDRARDTDLRTRLIHLAWTQLDRQASPTNDLTGRLANAGRNLIRDRSDRMASLAGRLDAMSPLKVLSRGYAIVTHADDGRAVRDAREVQPGDDLHVRVGEGKLNARVTSTEPSGSESPSPDEQ